MLLVVDNRLRADVETPKFSLTTKLIDALRRTGKPIMVVDHRSAPPIPWGSVRRVVLSGSGLCLSRTEDHAVHAFARAVLLGARKRGVPCLGVCFGMQVMARALGATVVSRAAPPCYRFPCAWVDCPVYFNHTDGVLPHPALGGAEVHPAGHVLSFRHGDWTGVQWHPEGTMEGRAWLDAYANEDEKATERN